MGFFWLLVVLIKRSVSSYRLMGEMTSDFVFYVYIGSLGGLIGYIPFVLTHSGLFQNEIWLVMAFLLISIRLAEKNLVRTTPASSAG